MSDRYHYDRNGKYIGRSSDVSPDAAVGLLILLGVVAFLAYKALAFLVELVESAFAITTDFLGTEVFGWPIGVWILLAAVFLPLLYLVGRKVYAERFER